MTISSKSYPLVLFLLFLIWAGSLAINPVNRQDWALENVLVVIGLFTLFATYRKFRFSNLSYTLIFIFLIFHEIGSHYTYSEVPLTQQIGNARNHFDRFVHFLWGLLFFVPFREISLRVVKVNGIWVTILPLGFVMSTSLIFEEIEWAAASIFGEELGMAYLGIQGDIWDPHKDSLMAIAGALMVIFITASLRHISITNQQ